MTVMASFAGLNERVMKTEKIHQEEIRSLATWVSYKTTLLIHLCDNILSEEEGRKNMHRRFMECEKSRKKAKILNMVNKITGIFGMKFFYNNS